MPRDRQFHPDALAQSRCWGNFPLVPCERSLRKSVVMLDPQGDAVKVPCKWPSRGPGNAPESPEMSQPLYLYRGTKRPAGSIRRTLSWRAAQSSRVVPAQSLIRKLSLFFPALISFDSQVAIRPLPDQVSVGSDLERYLALAGDRDLDVFPLGLLPTISEIEKPSSLARAEIFALPSLISFVRRSFD